MRRLTILITLLVGSLNAGECIDHLLSSRDRHECLTYSLNYQLKELYSKALRSPFGDTSKHFRSALGELIRREAYLEAKLPFSPKIVLVSRTASDWSNYFQALYLAKDLKKTYPAGNIQLICYLRNYPSPKVLPADFGLAEEDIILLYDNFNSQALSSRECFEMCLRRQTCIEMSGATEALDQADLVVLIPNQLGNLGKLICEYVGPKRMMSFGTNFGPFSKSEGKDYSLGLKPTHMGILLPHAVDHEGDFEDPELREIFALKKRVYYTSFRGETLRDYVSCVEKIEGARSDVVIISCEVLRHPHYTICPIYPVSHRDFTRLFARAEPMVGVRGFLPMLEAMYLGGAPYVQLQPIHMSMWKQLQKITDYYFSTGPLHTYFEAQRTGNIDALAKCVQNPELKDQILRLLVILRRGYDLSRNCSSKINEELIKRIRPELQYIEQELIDEFIEGESGVCQLKGRLLQEILNPKS